MFKKWLSVGSGLSVAAVVCLGFVAAWGQERQGGPGGGGPGRFGGGPMAFPLLRALDVDNDGELSAKEIENASKALKTLDADKDGKLSRTELMGEFGRPGGRGPGGGFGGPDSSEVVARYMAFDKNGDGKLAKDELPPRMQGVLERGDVNKDGFVDKDELTKLAERTGGRGGMGFGPRGEEGKPAGKGQRRPPDEPQD